MICKNCGAENPDYYVFCQNCFADLNESRETEQESAQTQSGGYSDPYSPAGEKEQERYPGQAAYEEPAEYRQEGYDSVQGQRPPARRGQTPEGRREPLRQATRSQGEEAPSRYDENAYYYEDDSQDRMGNATPASRRPAQGNAPATRQNAPRRRPPAAEAGEGDVSIGNVVSHGISPRELRQRERQAQRDARELEKLATNAGAEYYDYYDYYDEAAVEREKHRSKKTGLIIAIILLVVLAAAVVLGVFYANNTYGGIGPAIDSIFGGGVAGGDAVVVEAHTNEDGIVGHRIIVRAKKGQRISFADPEIGQEYEVNDGEPRAFFVPDEVWIPEDPAEDTPVLTVTPLVNLVEKTGSTQALEVPSFEVPVPQASITITEPAVLQGNVAESNTLQISGNAASGNGNPVKVLVHGYELTAGNLNPDGTFTCPVTLQGQDYSIEVVAKASRCRPMTVVLTGTVGGAAAESPGATGSENAAAASGAFVLDESVSLQTDQSELIVTGQGPTGGTDMTVRGAAAEITYDGATGRFSFAARLTDLGLNTFDLQVGDQQETLVFRRTPNVNEYTASAVALDFNYALENQSQVFNRVYSFEGTVLEILEESPAYTFTVGLKDDNSKVVQVTYYGLDTPKVGENFLIYGSANGNTAENSRLRMSAYFMYSDEVLAGLQNQSAEEASE